MEFLDLNCRGDGKIANRATYEGAHQPAAAERVAQIAGDRADIRSRTAFNLDFDFGVTVASEDEAVDVHRARIEREGFSTPRQLVRAPAGDVNGGIPGGHLHDRARERLQR